MKIVQASGGGGEDSPSAQWRTIPAAMTMDAVAGGRAGAHDRWSWSRTFTLARHQLRLLWREWTLPFVYLAIPLIICAFVRDTYGAALRAGVPGATGAEVAVPGQAIVAGFLVLALLGWSMFLDHRWGTWTRLRAAPVRPAEVVVARLGVGVLHLLAQFALVLLAGRLVFGLVPIESWLSVGAVAVATVVMIAGFGAMALAFSRTNPVFDAFATVGSLVLCGLGGAITPEELMPGWAKAVAPFTPVTWAMRGFRSCYLSGVDSVTGTAIIALLGFAGLFFGVAVLRFRFDESRAASTRG